MAWMRTPIYVWGTDAPHERTRGNVHIWVRKGEEVGAQFDPEDYPDFTEGVAIEQRVFDALVLYRMAELENSPTEMARAKRMAKKLAGNFGSFVYLRSIGVDPMPAAKQEGSTT